MQNVRSLNIYVYITIVTETYAVKEYTRYTDDKYVKYMFKYFTSIFSTDPYLCKIKIKSLARYAANVIIGLRKRIKYTPARISHRDVDSFVRFTRASVLLRSLYEPCISKL